MPSQDLERSVDQYSGSVANKVIRSRRSPKIWDYPAAVVSCKKNNGDNRIYSGRSSKPTSGMYEPLLEIALTQLGGVGQQSRNGCPYTIGNCAEPHAANKLLKNTAAAVGLEQILFSTALRPRTRQVIPYCANCRAVFPSLTHQR